jgi:hypothetical protein
VDEDLPDELNFVHILDLIAQMESSSADSGDDDDDNCENPFFRVCKLSSDRSKTLSGKSGDDWPLTRLIGSARYEPGLPDFSWRMTPKQEKITK